MRIFGGNHGLGGHDPRAQSARSALLLKSKAPCEGDKSHRRKQSSVNWTICIVDGRRKKLFPNLRRFVVEYDLKVSEGRVARNVLSESMSAQCSTRTKEHPMGWGQRWRERAPRPKSRRLTETEQHNILHTLENGMSTSP